MSDEGLPAKDIRIEDLPLLEGVPLDRRQSVLRCLDARILRFEKDDLLAGHFRTPQKTYYLVEGEALIVCYDAAGNRSILGTHRKGAIIASEIAPDFCQINGIDVIASEPCTCLEFGITQEVEACDCCVKHINRVRGNLVASLATANMQLMKRLDMLSNRTTREKVLAYLQERAQEVGSRTFSIPYNRQELADYLYIERSALSRELGRMKRENIISYDRNRFTLLD